MQDNRNRYSPDMAAIAAWDAQQKRIDKLEEWIVGISDDHQAIPSWIQQSARSLISSGET
jgi:hypothetical protein